MSHLYERAAASEAGYAAGRARRGPTTLELERFQSITLSSAYRRGVRRGRKAQALFEQMTLPGTVPETGGGAVRQAGARGHHSEGQSVAPGRDYNLVGGER